MKTQTRLDADELLHVAIRASQANRHEEAIEHLKHALELAPDNPKIHYMLGAEHAEIGLYDRAAVEMTRAVQLDPSLMTALFQLGLLHITSGRVPQAEEAWAALDDLGEEHPLRLFKSGLLHLARDEFAECIAALEQGIQRNTINDPLNNDMQRILNDVRARTGSQAPPAEKPAGKKPAIKPVKLSAYKQNDDDKDAS